MICLFAYVIQYILIFANNIQSVTPTVLVIPIQSKAILIINTIDQSLSY